MTSSSTLETSYVVVLFAGYAALWRAKRVRQRRATGLDPEVLRDSTDPLQRFLAMLARVLTGALVAIIAAHALGLDPERGITRPWLAAGVWAHAGLAVGLAGLGLCWIAQRQMGSSWRVGIDEVHRTELVTSGVYGIIRNPTYLGLYMVIAGVWLILPSCAVTMFAVAFFMMLEVQVRCEEQHLLHLHGAAYREYASRTWRYLPGVY